MSGAFVGRSLTQSLNADPCGLCSAETVKMMVNHQKQSRCESACISGRQPHGRNRLFHPPHLLET